VTSFAYFCSDGNVPFGAITFVDPDVVRMASIYGSVSSRKLVRSGEGVSSSSFAKLTIFETSSDMIRGRLAVKLTSPDMIRGWFLNGEPIDESRDRFLLSFRDLSRLPFRKGLLQENNRSFLLVPTSGERGWLRLIRLLLLMHPSLNVRE
jgi:hypothetical protein